MNMINYMEYTRSSVPKPLDCTIYPEVHLGMNKESDGVPQKLSHYIVIEAIKGSSPRKMQVL